MYLFLSLLLLCYGSPWPISTFEASEMRLISHFLFELFRRCSFRVMNWYEIFLLRKAVIKVYCFKPFFAVYYVSLTPNIMDVTIPPPTPPPSNVIWGLNGTDLPVTVATVRKLADSIVQYGPEGRRPSWRCLFWIVFFFRTKHTGMVTRTLGYLL